MNELVTNDYKVYKKTLDAELKTNVESFVRIGYLLKVARDTDVLSASGYRNVAEFAKAEYGLTKDVVSRYIAINDRYSENGYSDTLQLQFENFGVAKLSEMLTLPDNIIEEIEPTLTRKEIQDIKKEVLDEEKITPLEVYMEGIEEKNVKEEKEYTFTQRVWLEFFRSENHIFATVEKAVNFKPFPEDKDIETLYDILAPSGEAAVFARVPGIGKIMIHLKGASLPVTMTPVRGGEKTECTVKDIYYDIAEIINALEEERKAAPEEEQKASEEIMPAPIVDEEPEQPVEEVKEEATEQPEEEKAVEPVEEKTEPITEEAAEPAEEKTEDPIEEPEELEEQTPEEAPAEEVAAEQTPEEEAKTEEEKPEEPIEEKPEPVEEEASEPEEEKPTEAQEEEAAEPAEEKPTETQEEEAAEPAEEPVDMSACMFRIFDASSIIKDIASANLSKDAYLMSNIDRIIAKAQEIIDNATRIKEA